MSDWLELELARELCPVRAPEGLWGGVQASRGQRAAGNRRAALRLPAVAAVALLIAAGAVWSGRRPLGFETLAARELARPGRLELHSCDAREIGAWLRREAGVEVRMPVSSKVRLEGARVIRQGGAFVGEVAYHVDDHPALLLVARAGTALRTSVKHGGLSWEDGRQVYALACSAPGHAACALCHTNL